jgi:2-dehydro-3-deoxy-D-arabinonate dehydratase
MKLARIQTDQGPAVARIDGDSASILKLDRTTIGSLADILAIENPAEVASRLPVAGSPIALTDIRWLPPIDDQEVWAAGVTYKRSQTARMEESETAASCYDRVYKADRPEIFFKATPSRCSGHQGPLRIRVDAKWNVPEPELALVISPNGAIVGYTIGNDMSSRDIEGDNPLYLPQAKVYNQCCGLGPWITLSDAMPERSSIKIDLNIGRGAQRVFTGSTTIAQMARNFEDLVQWLFRDNSFPRGVFLLTGTGVVPDSNFTLAPRDVVTISISGIGTLVNTIVQG